MAVLSARFRLIDEMSERLDAIARSGETAVNRLSELDYMSDKALNSATASADSASAALDNFEKETIGAVSAMNELTNTGEAAERALEQEARAADEAAEQVEQLGNTTEKAGKQSEKFGEESVDAIQQLSQVLTAAGIARMIHEIYDAFADAVSEAIEFESAVTGVYKTVDGTADQLSQISSEIKAMSLVMPASAIEISGVAEAAGQLGIATGDITAFTEVMINLGEATNLSADEAASALAKFSNITGMSSANYENLGSAVVALGNNFATTEADIVAMSTRMASAGTLAGLTEPEILALAASMPSVGIEADAGGSAMSKLLTDIQVAVETGSDRLKEFASVAGMTGNEFADVFGNSASDALYRFIDGLNDVERNGATATVILEGMGLTEVRLSNAVKSLASNSDGLSDAIDVANGAWLYNTALATEAELRYSTLESKLAMNENAARNLAVAVGDDLTPTISGFVDIGSGALEWLTEVVEGNPAVTAALAGTAVGLGVVATAIVAHTTVMLSSIPAIAAFTGTLTAAFAALGPVTLAVAGIAAVGTGVVLLSNALGDANEEYYSLTEGSKHLYEKLDVLNDEYETAVKLYGENSEAAQKLSAEIAGLDAVYSQSRLTIEEFTSKNEALISSHDKLVSSYQSGLDKIGKEERGVFALVERLDELSSKTNLSAVEQQQMSAIIGRLNEQLPDLSLSYD